MLVATVIWSLTTIAIPPIVRCFSHPVSWSLILLRVVHGAAQGKIFATWFNFGPRLNIFWILGFHFPSLTSLSSKKLNEHERGPFFSIATAGGALGAILAGTAGSLLLYYFGWPDVFRLIGKIKFYHFTQNLNISHRWLWAGVGLAAAVCECQKTKNICAAASAKRRAKRRWQICRLEFAHWRVARRSNESSFLVNWICFSCAKWSATHWLFLINKYTGLLRLPTLARTIVFTSCSLGLQCTSTKIFQGQRYTKTIIY